MNAPMITGGRTLRISALALAGYACNASDDNRADAVTQGGAGLSRGSTRATTAARDSTGGQGTNRSSKNAPSGSTTQAAGGAASSDADGTTRDTGPAASAPIGGSATTSLGDGGNTRLATDAMGGASNSGRASRAKTTTDPSGGTSNAIQSQASGGLGAGTSSAKAPVLCVFDYDLTLSTHACSETEGDPASLCRVATDCGVYGWSEQCMARQARAAVAECVRRGAYIGIASHSPFEGCWDDKIVPIVAEHQFPEFTDSPHYDSQSVDFTYPAVDAKANWNCESCAYQMETSVTKTLGISRIMRHYGMNPDSASDRRRVLFWDDDPNNIKNVETNLPEVVSITVPRHGATGADGGCGITPENIDEAWSQIP